MAAVCTLTPAAEPPLLPTPLLVAGCCSDRSAWGSKKPGRASASESWTRDKLIARTSSNVLGRASLSESWSKDKAERERKETVLIERVGRSSSRESDQVGTKRAPSRALSVEVDRSEKKARPVEEDAVPVVYYTGPTFIKSPDPSEVPLPKFRWLVKSPDPSELPIPRFLNLKAPKEADNN